MMGRNTHFKKFTLCSWNIRGMGEPGEEAAIFLRAETYEAAILCLQETHLTKDSAHQLRCREYKTQIHPVHTSYSRGTSILIRNDVAFFPIQSKIDERGRYAFLYCRIENVLANVYIPPPFDTAILVGLVEFMLDKPGVPVVVAGDFSMVTDFGQDRFPPSTQTKHTGNTRLTEFMMETGLRDIWRTRSPETRQYSCFSKTHSTLSRIDLTLGNEEMVLLIKSINYNPRGLSDHSPGDGNITNGRTPLSEGVGG